MWPDASSGTATQDFKEKKKVVGEAEHGRDDNGEEEADNEVEEEEDGEGGHLHGRLKVVRMATLAPRSRGPLRMTKQQKRKS